MKFCTKCGTQLHDDDAFCTHCGCATPQFEFQTETINLLNSSETNNTNFKTDSRISILKQAISNYKTIITITAAVLCVVIFGIIYLKQIPYKCLDVKDDELIETLDELGVNVSFSPLKHNELEELDGFDGIDTDTTIYRITALEEIGILVLSHGFSGHIRCIMVCFDNNTVATAIISALASELDYSFSTSKAMNSILLDGEIYTSDSYTIMKKDLSSELSGIFLTPKEHLEFSVKSILSN